METFSALLAICAGNSPVPGEFPTQRPVRRSFDVFFDLRLNLRLSEQWWGWWFETLSLPLWRHRYVCGGDSCIPYHIYIYDMRTGILYWFIYCVIFVLVGFKWFLNPYFSGLLQLAPGHLYDCPGVSDARMKDEKNWLVTNDTQQSTTRALKNSYHLSLKPLSRLVVILLTTHSVLKNVWNINVLLKRRVIKAII